MQATSQPTLGRWAQPPRRYELVTETLNCGLPDLLVEKGRSAVVDAFLALARESQELVKLDPENSELQDYARSLAWHYCRLREAAHLDAVIERASALKKKADALSTLVASLPPRFEAAMQEVGALEQFVKRQPLHVTTPIWKEPPREELKNGLLAPRTLAQLPRMASDLEPVELLDGIISFLPKAPWVVRQMPGLFEEYFADPGQRLEFVAACDALLPTIKVLKNDLKKSADHQKAAAKARSARMQVDNEWNRARQGMPIPQLLADLAKTAMGLVRHKAPEAQS